MKVLTVIGIAILCMLLTWLIGTMNEKTYEKYKFRFLGFDFFTLYAVITGLSYFGHKWYLSALEIDGDLLNGLLLMSFATILFILILVANIKRTSFFIGIGITLLQTIIYVPLSVVSFIALLIALAYFSQTKPVYTVNK
ncbi:hypothetical protein [Poseidonibacter ostreae]|uniref:Uncharacterized protein n=1 Tax=Poseidonibacter ostreae TaxID=2654171 RepID=A0A6L4WQY3_9BACT|nr:hypothetical protein [Poseidonibacter ostreae]KAB7881231.1 hypothetical protein GA417_14180 [Poseidonibacter ostreae]KAB7884278.1 hypothetical protein GBG19_16015 [Poseidonibacter ostreae]KAB7886495.1 hypothetical protein GBG18_14575 [Poseidonibacter ostreae]